MKRSFFAAPYGLWMLIFTILPIVFVGYYACTDKAGAFSLENWTDFFTAANLTTLWVSIRLALECTLVCLLVGYPAALIMAGRDFSKHKTLFVGFRFNGREFIDIGGMLDEVRQTMENIRSGVF